MGLRDLSLPQAEVRFGDGEDQCFTVRGLSPNDAIGLYHRHSGQLAGLYDRFAVQTPDDADVKAITLSLISSVPLLMGEIIALASGGSPGEAGFAEDVSAAVRLPMGVQADALEKVAAMTFTSDMPAGKFLALVAVAARAARAQMESQPA